MTNDEDKGIVNFFYFNWAAFDAVAGVKYLIGIILIYLLGGWLNFPWFTAGVCALLVWLTDVPGLRKDRVLGMAAYGLWGVLLTLLFHSLGGNFVLQLIATFAVSFAGTMLMLRGARAYMVGWCCVYWFLLVPLFSNLESGPSEVVTSMISGTAVVIVLTLLGGLFGGHAPDRPENSSIDDAGPETGFVAGYSLTMAIVMVVGLLIGSMMLETDPTLVANAAFMVIGMDSKQTWVAGVERSVGAILGIIVGFYLFQYATNDLVIFMLGAAFSFLCMALMNVNPAAFIFFFLAYMSHSWVVQGLEQANLIANERIVAELVGVVLAGVAVSSLVWWTRRRVGTVHVKARQSGL